jgi:hypothetical protein
MKRFHKKNNIIVSSSFLLSTNFLFSVLLSCIYFIATIDSNNVALATSRLQCPNECSNSLDNTTTTPHIKRGVCVDGICHCYSGFTGVDCSAGHGPKNKDKFKIKNTAIIKILEDEDITCDSASCSELCAFGGSCISKFTCKCFNKWGKGPADVLKPSNSSSSDDVDKKTDPHRIKVFYRKPLAKNERIYLLSVMRSLGVPPQKGDPCRSPWTNPRGFLMVSCNPEGHIVGLDFGRMNLKGTISPAIGKLPYLRDIAMNNNLIRGNIPSQIGHLKELEMLLLYKNHLVGEIPDLSKTRLINLVLYGNFLTGGIPKSLANLFETLLMIDVSFNKLDGTVPSSIYKMEKLDTLYINHNHLHGLIPKGVDQLNSIKNMRYEENHFDNKVKNIGNNEVWSDQTHDDRTEIWGDEWKYGLVYDKRERKVVFEQSTKKKAEIKAKEKKIKEKADGAAKKAAGDKWLKEKFKDPEPSNEKADPDKPAKGMEITDKQPSDTKIME